MRSARCCALALFVDGPRTARDVFADREGATRCRVEILESAPAHLAVVALAGGLLPFLLGGAWAVANLLRIDRGERRVFAWLTVVTVVVLTVEVASFNLRFGGGLVRERYLFYLTPLLLCAFAAALTAARLPRWSLLAPLSIVVDRILARADPDLREAERRHSGVGALRLAAVDDARHRRHASRARCWPSVVVCLLVVEADASLPARAARGRLCARCCSSRCRPRPATRSSACSPSTEHQGCR